MRFYVSVLLAGLFALLDAGVAWSENTPIAIKPGEVQLFVDDYLLESPGGDVQRTLRQPKKDTGGNEAILSIDNEFGGLAGTIEANGTIVYDPKIKKWVMLTLAFSSPSKHPNRIRIYRFTSPDGMNWVKGDDGTPEVIPFDLYDPASKRSATNNDLFSFYYDEKDAAYPYKGWLWFANWDELEGIYYVRSADGKKWERGQQINQIYSHFIEQDGRKLKGPGDVTIFTPDPLTGRFLALVKFVSVDPVGPKNMLRSRAFMYVDSLDQPMDLKQIQRVSLLPAAEQTNGDEPHDEYYGSTAWRYGGMWLGALKVWHGGGDHPYSAAGCAYLKLASSRDGLNWKKVQFKNDSGIPEVFVPNGKEGGNNGKNDGGYMTEFSNAPIRIGDELIYYYGSSSYGKNHPNEIRVSGGGIFRARLRPDGFVSVDSGTLTTKPLTFDAHELFANGIGPIDVEVIGPDGTAKAQTTLHGDSLKHIVRFDGKALGEIAGGQAQLRFTVDADESDGQLYSFTIGE